MAHTEQAKYPTDLADDEWQIVRKLLPQPSRLGAPQTICRRAVVNAILYVLRSGCAWRLFPHEFQKWKTVYGIFRAWRDDETWQMVHDSLPDKRRRREGRKTSPSAAIVDSQKVNTTEVRGKRGYDSAKRVNGRKRHIVVETLGLILAFVVLPKRWIVERTFGRLGRYRRHSKDYERNTASSEPMS